MGTGKGSPSRRKSTSVVNPGHKAHLGYRRRAHSIAPGQRLSPASKARRSLAPRKSILKAALSPDDTGDGETTTLSQNDSRVEISDKDTRKSFGRRVSFAEHAHVRLFETQEQNTNSTASPKSSPVVDPEKAGDIPQGRVMNDENAYPGARVFQRRPSIRHSLAFTEGGEQSMDMDMDDTAPGPSVFFNQVGESAILNGFDDFGIEGDEDDMDMTTAFTQNILRMRTPSLGPQSRPPLAHLTPEHPIFVGNDSMEHGREESFTEDMSLTTHSALSIDDDSQPMEFTVPLVRPPAPPTDAWLALRSVTHSGGTPYVPPGPEEGSEDGMELTDALSRLMAMRRSLSLVGDDESAEDQGQGEPSFTNTDDSFDDPSRGDSADQTINVTQLRRMSEAYTVDMQIDETEDLPRLEAESPAKEIIVPPSPVFVSPSTSGMLTNVRASPEPTPQDATEHWREGVQQEEEELEDVSISIQQFFDITGIRFMDEITAPPRSAMRPSILPPARRSSAGFEIPLADYVVGSTVNVPQLDLYMHVSKDLEAWIERIKVLFEEAEDEAGKITPELFKEYMAAEPEGKSELLHQLMLIKVNAHGLAKSEWYDWKLQWIQQLHQEAARGFTSLELDAKVLEGVTHQAREIVPHLREEYQQIMRELEEEQSLVADIESCDQDYLNELKATLAEQSAELEAFRVDVAESNAKLEALQGKANEMESQKQETTADIAGLRRFIHVQKSSTRFEVYRLKDELEALQGLHKWRIMKARPDLVEAIYESVYRVSIPCTKGRPICLDIKIESINEAKGLYKHPFPVLNNFMLTTAKQFITNPGENCGVREIIERLALKYPVSITITHTNNNASTGFTAVATIMFPKVKGKAQVSFTFDTTTFASWPVSIDSIQYSVDVAYGPIDKGAILRAVVDRVRQSSADINHACLREACNHALELYS